MCPPSQSTERKTYWIIEVCDDPWDGSIDGPYPFAEAMQIVLRNPTFKSYLWRLPDRHEGFIGWQSNLSSLYIFEHVYDTPSYENNIRPILLKEHK